jgi:protein-S-isoprenylcysteine O-methyltransferase Ste14
MKIFPPAILGLAYFVSELVLALTKRSKVAADSKDANSLRVLWIVIGASVWLSIQLQATFPTASLPAPFAAIGLLLFVVGIYLRWYSIIHLGRFFTIDVAIAADHQVIDSGPYRCVRHPSYTGALLAFAGFGLVMRNWVSLLAITVPIFVAFLYRIKVEERALLEALGDHYRVYAKRTKRLIPFVY